MEVSRRPRGARVALPEAAVLFGMLLILSGCRLFGDGIDRAAMRNVIVITMDTTRADHIAAYGYERIETPNIDSLASNGVLFETAITAAPLTLPGHTTIFTGRYPHRHGVRNNGTFRVPPEADTLAEMLKRRGFRTGAVIGAYVLDSKYGLDQGFDMYDDNLHGGKEGPMFMFDERPGRMVTDQAITWIESHKDERFFLWIHYFDPHANYEPPPPFDVLYDGRPYDGEIAGVDAQIGRLLTTLRNVNHLDDTLIILTADHGESLGEHGEKTHSMFIYDATMRVPLIMRHPALPRGQRVRGQVRTVDIVPTVLDLLDFPIEGDFDGESLVPAMLSGKADTEAYIETLVPRFNNRWAELRGVRTTKTKYIRAPRSELYDLLTDPHELRNLLAERADDVRLLSRRLDQYLKTDVMRTAEGEKAELRLTSTDRERLEALGYNVSDTESEASEDLPDPKDKISGWEEFQNAQDLMRKHKHEEAIVALRAVIEKDPGNVLAHSSLGNALIAVGKLDEAEKEFETVRALDPRRTQVHLSIARLHRRRGDRARAFEALKKALEQDRTSPELAVEFADLFRDAGQTNKAIEWYEEALNRDPLYVKALIGMSDTYHRAGRETDARAALDRALKIDPRNADALYNLGVISEAEGKKEEALSYYRRALEVEPDHIPALNNLGSYFDQSGETAKAIAAYRRVLERNPQHFEANYNLGTLMLREKRHDEAIALLERALAIRPQAGIVYNNLAMAYLDGGRHGDAIELLKKAAEADPKTSSWWLRLARAEVQAGRRADAKAHFERAVEIGGESIRQRMADDPVLGPLARAPKRGGK